MKFLIPLLLLSVFVSSCVTNSEEDRSQLPSNDDSIIFGDTTFKFAELSEPAKVQAVRWGVLEDFLSEAIKANGSNYQGLRNRSESLREYSDSLFKNIPDTLNTKPINSRLLVLKTRTELLFQTAHRATIDSLNLQEAMGELNIAVNNLIVHLNEKFQKDNIDFQRKEDEDNELKKQKRFRDSVMNLEMQDQNNKKV